MTELAGLLFRGNPDDPRPAPPDWLADRLSQEGTLESAERLLDDLTEVLSWSGTTTAIELPTLPELTLEQRVERMEYEHATREWQERNTPGWMRQIKRLDTPLLTFQSPVTFGDYTNDQDDPPIRTWSVSPY